MKTFLMMMVIVWFVFGVSAANERGLLQHPSAAHLHVRRQWCPDRHRRPDELRRRPSPRLLLARRYPADTPIGGSASSVPSQVAATGPHSASCSSLCDG